MRIKAVLAAAVLFGASYAACAGAEQGPAADSATQDARSLVGQAAQASAAGRYDEASQLAGRALEIAQRAGGSAHPEAIAALNELAWVRYLQGQYVVAEQLFRRAITEGEPSLGREHAHILMAVNGLGIVYQDQGRFVEAEPLFRRALGGRERTLGRDHPRTLAVVYNLGRLLMDRGQLSEAEPLLRSALDRGEHTMGRQHPDVLEYGVTLAGLYRELGRYADAEALGSRVLADSQGALGPSHPRSIGFSINLGGLYRDQGRYADAEPLLRRGAEALQASLGANHPDTLTAFSNLANLYEEQGRYAEAEFLQRRTLEARERVLGPEHPRVIFSLRDLAILYYVQGRYEEAEPLLRRALEASERVLGNNHPNTLSLLPNLAAVYTGLGRMAEAEPLVRRALLVSEGALGPTHPLTLSAADTLGFILLYLNRQNEAEPFLRRAFDGRQRMFGPAHPVASQSASAMTVIRLIQAPAGSQALESARLLRQGLLLRRRSAGTDQQARAQLDRELGSAAAGFALFADAAWAAGGAAQLSLRAEAFEALQLSVAGAADRSIAEQAARRYVAGRDAALLAVMRERQQLEAEWNRLDTALLSVIAGELVNQGERATALRHRLEVVQARIAEIDGRLRVEAPDYFALIEPSPVSFSETQRLLAPDEAIVLAVPSRFGTHVVAVAHDRIEWRRSDWNSERVRSVVQTLRRDIDRRPRFGPSGARAFDRTTAHQLYQELIAPVSDLIAGRRQVYVAAGGSLAALPFSMLVAAPPAGADDDPAALRSTRWFGDEVALVHTPSIQALALLRAAPRADGDRSGFFGIGNPVLRGDSAAAAINSGAPRGTDIFFQSSRSRDGGVVANVATLQRLSPLPGTAIELEAVRTALGAPHTSLLMAERATEPNVRNADYSRTRILLFSTHGLTVAEGAYVGAGESGLVMTPPAEAREGDDGFLSASEVTTLRLSADWVILSACNTATGDGVNSAGLGGLARAFFFAGARNLLASHWLVSDEVAPILITRTLALERGGAARAEAFRQAMRDIRMDSSRDSPTWSWAHPYYWAPFVIIGDGGR